MPKLGQLHFKIKAREQIGFLRTSCELYDRGRTEEAVRMAAAIRVLFHHRPRKGKGGSTSLIHHLGRPEVGMFSQGGLYRPGPIFFDRFNLCGGIFRPPEPGSGDGFPVPFEYWWNDVILLASGREFSRRDFVLTMADKDGGAHVDDELPEDYLWVVTRGIYFTEMTEGGPVLNATVSGDQTPAGTPFLGSHRRAVRCIAAEVLRSTELIALAGR